MEKNIWIGCLLDVYGDLLPKKQKNLIDMVYNEDLSLSEISEMEGITRQGVHDSVRRGEHLLQEYEDTLHMIADRDRLQQQLLSLQQLLIEGNRMDLGNTAAVSEMLTQACKMVAELLPKEE